MKLRPTKSDRKALDNLKKSTGETTYTKAIMRAARDYPIMIKTINELQENIGKLHNELNTHDRAAELVLDGLEMLKRLRKLD